MHSRFGLSDPKYNIVQEKARSTLFLIQYRGCYLSIDHCTARHMNEGTRSIIAPTIDLIHKKLGIRHQYFIIVKFNFDILHVKVICRLVS